MNILITGAAGFIGFHVCKQLVDLGHFVVGLDNLNNYYDVSLKLARIKELGIEEEEAKKFNSITSSYISNYSFKFIRISLEDKMSLSKLFKEESFDKVCNLAAQAGVRYSLENPDAYISSNILGFQNVLDCCKTHNVKHLVYASSSSVYGLNDSIPFKTTDNVDQPISIYAATKKSNELMAHTYSHLYGIKTTGLRFFTVYGPWGRPDMAMFLFTDAIIKGEPLKVFNYGNMERDFTFINDITKGVIQILEKKYEESEILYKIYNIGNNNSVKLMDFIKEIEINLGLKARYEFLPMQEGDVEKTWANIDSLIKDYGYVPNTPVEKGISEFINWYKNYYKID